MLFYILEPDSTWKISTAVKKLRTGVWGGTATHRIDIRQNGSYGKTVLTVLVGKHPYNPSPPTPSYTLEAYGETPIFITLSITENVVRLVVRELSGGSGTRATDSEA